MQFAVPEWIERSPSTNSALAERLAAGEDLASGYVLATHEQTAGRGRGQRRWLTQPGRDLACSFVLHAAVEPRQLASLSMAVALGVAAGLESYGVKAQTKWPNDVIVGGRKICGILPELASGAVAGARPAIIVGMGVNVGLSAAEAQAVDQPATSILIEAGKADAPVAVLERLLPALVPFVRAWERGGFAVLRTAWESSCAGLGKRVTIVDGDSRHRGVLAGFGDDGQLRLDTGEGEPADVWTGHLLLA